MNQRSYKFGIFILGLFVLAFIMVAVLQTGGGVPSAFADGTSFDDATAKSNETGKPVLVLASADWCPPCRQLKSSTLRDERVEAAIRDRTIPVYLDLTIQSANTAEAQIARQLNISSLPTMVLWRPEGEIARQVGVMPPVEMLTWLERH